MADENRATPQPPTDLADLAERLRLLNQEDLAKRVETAGSLTEAAQIVQAEAPGEVAAMVLSVAVESGEYGDGGGSFLDKVKGAVAKGVGRAALGPFGAVMQAMEMGDAAAGAVADADIPGVSAFAQARNFVADAPAQLGRDFLEKDLGITLPDTGGRTQGDVIRAGLDGFGDGTVEAVAMAERFGAIVGRADELAPWQYGIDLTGAAVMILNPQSGNYGPIQDATGLALDTIPDGSMVKLSATEEWQKVENLRPGGGLVDPVTGEISDDQVAQALGLATGEASDPYAVRAEFAGSPAFETITDPETGAVTHRLAPALPPAMQMLVDSDFKFSALGHDPFGSFILDPSDLYFAGDGTRIFNSMSLERRRQLQKDLMEAGLISEDEELVGSEMGRYTPATRRAFEALLAHSNETQMKWHAALPTLKRANVEVQELADQKEREDLLKGLSKVPKMVFEAPDYAALARDVKGWFGERLGREPQDYELTLFADKLAGFHRSRFDAEVATAEQQRQVAVRALINDEDPLTGSADGGTVQAVSPEARMQALLDERYGPELERLKGIGETATNQDLQRRASDTITRMVGG